MAEMFDELLTVGDFLFLKTKKNLLGGGPLPVIHDMGL